MQEKNKKESKLKWPIQAFFLTFILSGIVSFVSNNGIERLNLILSIVNLFDAETDIVKINIIIINIFFFIHPPHT